MAENNKKYYWLKLKEGFFGDKEIKKLRRIAGGDTYTIIYLKLMLLSLRNDGRLYYEGIEDTFAEELALEIDEEPENVTVAVSYLAQMGLMESISDNEASLTMVPEAIGSETEKAAMMRKKRARDKFLGTGNNVTNELPPVTECYPDIEIDIDKDKEIETEKDIEIDPSYLQSVQETKVIRAADGNDRRNDGLVDKAVIETVRDQINYNRLLWQFDREDVDLAVSIVLHMRTCTAPQVVAGRRYDAALLREKFSEISYEHVEHAYNQFYSIRDRVVNPRGYLMAVLFNSIDELGCRYSNDLRVDGVI